MYDGIQRKSRGSEKLCQALPHERSNDSVQSPDRDRWTVSEELTTYTVGTLIETEFCGGLVAMIPALNSFK